MKKLLLAAVISTLALNVSAEETIEELFATDDGSNKTVNASYNSISRELTLPVVEIDGVPSLSDARLEFRDDGLLEVTYSRKYNHDTDYVPLVAEEKIVEVPVEKIVYVDRVVEKEVCTATPAGIEAFTVSDDYDSAIYIGKTYRTSTGHLISITGTTVDEYYSKQIGYGAIEYSFAIAPDALPEPEYGTKGGYYYIQNGEVAYADFL